MTVSQSTQEAPKYQPATEALLAEISGTQYRSQLGMRELMMRASRIRPRLPGEDIAALEAARDKRWGELTISPEVELGLDIPEPLEQVLPDEEPWSPARGMTDEGVQREANWHERQLPVGDRDEHLQVK